MDNARPPRKAAKKYLEKRLQVMWTLDSRIQVHVQVEEDRGSSLRQLD